MHWITGITACIWKPEIMLGMRSGAGLIRTRDDKYRQSHFTECYQSFNQNPLIPSLKFVSSYSSLPPFYDHPLPPPTPPPPPTYWSPLRLTSCPTTMLQRALMSSKETLYCFSCPARRLNPFTCTNVTLTPSPPRLKYSSSTCKHRYKFSYCLIFYTLCFVLPVRLESRYAHFHGYMKQFHSADKGLVT